MCELILLYNTKRVELCARDHYMNLVAGSGDCFATVHKICVLGVLSVDAPYCSLTPIFQTDAPSSQLPHNSDCKHPVRLKLQAKLLTLLRAQL